jgi:hypothetical protein
MRPPPVPIVKDEEVAAKSDQVLEEVDEGVTRGHHGANAQFTIRNSEFTQESRLECGAASVARLIPDP